MAKRTRPATPASATDIPVVGLREPCPCGSGRRYKACHGREMATRGERLVARPFEGLPGECDWVALRELVPAATAPLVLATDPGVSVTVATVLPLASPGLVRASGDLLLGLQVQTGSGDPSRDIADALERGLASEPGQPVLPAGLPGPGSRLQDLVDPAAPFTVTVHESFDFWLDSAASSLDDDVKASLDRASAEVNPTVRLTSVEAAYWTTFNGKVFLRWVLPYAEDTLLDALARLHVAEADAVSEGSRFIGSFRSMGLCVPVWELAEGTPADALEEPAPAFLVRLSESLSDSRPLSADERRARAGIQTRQVTLR